jgi:hypothetical protein
MLKTFPSSKDGPIQIKATSRIFDTGSRRLYVSLTVKYVYFRLIQQQYDKKLLYKNYKNYKCTNLKLLEASNTKEFKCEVNLKLCEDVGKTVHCHVPLILKVFASL